jgi:hypothetical protein
LGGENTIRCRARETNRWWELDNALTVSESWLELLLNTYQVDADILGAKGLLELYIGGVRDCLQENLDGILDILHVSVSNCFLDHSPAVGRLNVGEIAAVNLARVLAFNRSVAFLLTVLANLRGLIGAVGGAMTLFLAETAGTRELMSNTLVGAFGLGMA